VKRGGKKRKKKLWQKTVKKKEPKIKVLAHELLAFTLSYLMLTPWWYTNPSNLSSQTPLMLSLVVICLSFHYRIVLLPHYKLMPPPTSFQGLLLVGDIHPLAHPSLLQMTCSVAHKKSIQNSSSISALINPRTGFITLFLINFQRLTSDMYFSNLKTL
jgi:hypothetical protein